MKATLNAWGILELEGETCEEENFIKYWDWHRHSIKVLSSFPVDEASVLIRLEQSMPDSPITSETVNDWRKLQELKNNTLRPTKNKEEES